MLAEFKYGLEPKESFSAFADQAVPNRCVLDPYQIISLHVNYLSGSSIILKRYDDNTYGIIVVSANICSPSGPVPGRLLEFIYER